MRRSHLTAVTIVSTAILLTTTSMLAIGASKASMGMLKQQDGWKVGTVANGSENYCAMVGNYEKNVVVAFARNPDGLNSLALDFGQDMFTAGQQYDVNLAADGDRPRVMKARASSPRSLVVQTGAEEGGFYEALSRDSTLSVDSPAASMRVTMPKFSAHHKDLVECAGQLKPAGAAPVNEASKQAAMAPIDRELQQLGQAREQLADASAEATKISKKIEGKASSFNELEAQLEAEARAETERSRTTLASIGEQEQRLRAEIEKKGGSEALAAIEPAAGGERLSLDELSAPPSSLKSSGGRKLLASIGAKEAPQVPQSSGMSARAIEAEQMPLANSTRAASETAKALEEKALNGDKPVLLVQGKAPEAAQVQDIAQGGAQGKAQELQNEIAALEQEKNRAAQEKMAAFDARNQELAVEEKKIEQKRDSVLAKLASARAANGLSRAEKFEAPKVETSKTGTPKADAVMALSADGETGGMPKTDVTAAVKNDVAKNAALKPVELKPEPAKIAPLETVEVKTVEAKPPVIAETKLKASDIKWDEPVQVVGNTDTGSDTRKLRADIVASQAKLAEVKSVKATETAALTRNLAATQNEFETRIAALENERNSLKQQVASTVAENSRLKQGVAQGDNAEISQLKQKLAVFEAQRQSEMARAAAAQKELEEARNQVLELRQGSAAEQNRLTELQRQLETERAQLGAVKDAGAKVASAELEKERANLNALKGERDKKQVALQQEAGRIAAAKTGQEQTAETPVALAAMKGADGKNISPGAAILGASQRLMANERAELETLRTRIAALETDLGKAREETTVAKTALAAAPAPVDSRAETAEMGRLKAENAGLRDRLASFLNRDTKRADEERVAVKAAALNATEPAAGEAAKETVAALADSSPGNDKRMPAVPAGKVTAEQMDMPAVKVTEAVKSGDSEAEMEIARMAPITASVPVSKEDREQDKGVMGIFGRALGYGAATDNKADQVAAVAPVSEPVPAATKAVIRVTKPAAAPQPEAAAAPVTAKANGISADEANRAAAFLDNIMAFHRPGGGTAADHAKLAASATVPVAVEKPVVEETVVAAIEPAPVAIEETVTAEVKAAAPVATAALSPVAQKLGAVEPAAGAVVTQAPVPAPVRPAYLSQGVSKHVPAAVAAAAAKPVETPVSAAESLSAVEPAAGAAMAAPVRPLQKPAAETVQAAGQMIALDALLRQSGVGAAQIGAGAGGVYQWNAGAVNGMYEAMPSTGHHSEQAAGYLARYREDCPGNLDVRQGQPQKTASGSISTAVITCSAAGNTYATSLVFLDTAAGFQTVLHAGQPKDAAEVRRLGDNIASALQPAAGIRVTSSAPAVVPASYAAQPAAVVPAPTLVSATVAPASVPAVAPVQRKFRIQIDAPAVPPQGYDLPTTIIE